MTKFYTLRAFLLLLFASVFAQNVQAQCTWTTQFYDGFEYSTPCPDILPNTTYTAIPQSYAVRTGAKSLYANFKDCAGGVGVCAGDQYYERVVPVCVGLPIRFSAWFTTTFSGAQCDIKIEVTDSIGTILASTNSLVAAYAPIWTQYVSGSITPTTSTVILKFYTNVDGGNGNDLSMDDLRLEQCLDAGTNSYTFDYICNNQPVVDLFNSIPGAPVTTGTWTGPTALSGGYLGTFTSGLNTNGFYIYSSAPYGTAPGCPVSKDTVVTISANAPNSQLPSDTSICLNQSIVLNPFTNVNYSYLWSNGSTTFSTTASTTSATDTLVDYIVTITDFNGCITQDTISVSFLTCSSLNSIAIDPAISIYPNPSSGLLNFKFVSKQSSGNYYFTLTNIVGQIVLDEKLNSSLNQIDVSSLENGSYFYQIDTNNKRIAKGKLIINNP